MGLDMFLEKREQIHGTSFNEKTKEFDPCKIVVKVIKPNGSESTKTYDGKNLTIAVEAIYWRKFNALHKWFIDHCGDGDENLREMYVSHAQLKEIHGVLRKLKEELRLVDGKIRNGYTFDEQGKKVYNYADGKYIENKELAGELLPTAAGFFFGSTDYDEYYYDDVVDAEEAIGDLIGAEDFEKYEYHYLASW